MEENVPQREGPPKGKFNLLTNPTLMGWLTIIGTALGVYGLYVTFDSTKEVKPVYRVLSDVVITESRQSSKIKVYYDSVEVQNVRAVTIALWNAGNEFLDKSAFSQDKPLSIRSTVPVRILEAKAVATTRGDLKFVPVYHTTRTTGKPSNFYDYLLLQIVGDEGLEVGDGSTFSILYTGKTKGSWVVNARIKGVPKGFQIASKPATKVGIWEIIWVATIGIICFRQYKAMREAKFRGGDLYLFIFIFFAAVFFWGGMLWFGYQQIISSELPQILSK